MLDREGAEPHAEKLEIDAIKNIYQSQHIQTFYSEENPNVYGLVLWFQERTLADSLELEVLFVVFPKYPKTPIRVRILEKKGISTNCILLITKVLAKKAELLAGTETIFELTNTINFFLWHYTRSKEQAVDFLYEEMVAQAEPVLDTLAGKTSSWFGSSIVLDSEINTSFTQKTIHTKKLSCVHNVARRGKRAWITANCVVPETGSSLFVALLFLGKSPEHTDENMQKEIELISRKGLRGLPKCYGSSHGKYGGERVFVVCYEEKNIVSIGDCLELLSSASQKLARTYTRELLFILLSLHEHGHACGAPFADCVFLTPSKEILLYGVGLFRFLGDETDHTDGARYFRKTRGESWSPPEHFGRNTYQIDIWEVGVFAVELLFGKEVTSVFSGYKEFKASGALTGKIADFLSICFDKEDCEKKTMERLASHQFLNKEDEIDTVRAEYALAEHRRQKNENTSRLTTDNEVLGVLGRGGFGKVFKARNKLDGMVYAIKQVPLHTKRNKQIPNILKEVVALSQFNHENIVRYHQAWIEEGEPSAGGTETSETESSLSDTSEDTDAFPLSACLYIQMEYCPNKMLRDRIDECSLTKKDAWRILRDILEGLAYIHESGVVHRDLTPRNIFFDIHDKAKIGDFGLASLADSQWWTGVSPSSSEQGTSLYTSPEEIAGVLHNKKKCDMYSLGIIFLEMCTQPKTGMERVAIIKKARLATPVLPETLGKKQKEVLENLLSHNEVARYSANGLLESDSIPQKKDAEKMKDLIENVSSKRNRHFGTLLKHLFLENKSEDARGESPLLPQSAQTIRASLLAAHTREIAPRSVYPGAPGEVGEINIITQRGDVAVMAQDPHTLLRREHAERRGNGSVMFVSELDGSPVLCLLGRGGDTPEETLLGTLSAAKKAIDAVENTPPSFYISDTVLFDHLLVYAEKIPEKQDRIKSICRNTPNMSEQKLKNTLNSTKDVGSSPVFSSLLKTGTACEIRNALVPLLSENTLARRKLDRLQQLTEKLVWTPKPLLRTSLLSPHTDGVFVLAQGSNKNTLCTCGEFLETETSPASAWAVFHLSKLGTEAPDSQPAPTHKSQTAAEARVFVLHKKTQKDVEATLGTKLALSPLALDGVFCVATDLTRMLFRKTLEAESRCKTARKDITREIYEQIASLRTHTAFLLYTLPDDCLELYTKEQ
ncbi:MAG: PEK/GCN2 protein kinase [Amphiamblys sp. WSBS2006]|nr:MAG: PEK/GCN2 protein kinase [Amphiamblys sp. WSBS2006]